MIQLYALGAAVAISFGAGYKAHSMLQDGIDLAKLEAKEEFRAGESKTAKAVVELLQERDDNVKIITKWKTKYIDRPVNNLSCTDDVGLRIIESFSTSSAGKFTGEMSD